MAAARGNSRRAAKPGRGANRTDQGSCGGTPKRDGSGGGVGNRKTKKK